jgi:uncharacterized membrane protein YccC
MFEKFFTGIATEHLLGEGIKTEHLNDDRLGEVLNKAQGKRSSHRQKNREIKPFISMLLAIIYDFFLLSECPIERNEV